ncbi:MAG: hypothetical protein ACFCUH_10510 [Flavobacteriales bacterium]
MKQLLPFVAFGLAAVLSSCCRDEPICTDPLNPDCVNFDECWHTKPTAGFAMRTSFPGFGGELNAGYEWCDTILGGGVQFLADMPNADSYTWQVGNEPQTRSGVGFTIGFSSYTEQTQNINPNDTNFFNPIPVTLTVRNAPGTCVRTEDTLLTSNRNLVIARYPITSGRFVGRVEGEDFDRIVTLWEQEVNLDAPSTSLMVLHHIIGLPHEDTLTFRAATSWWYWADRGFKQLQWNKPEMAQWQAFYDGVYRLEQYVTRPPSGPDRVTLYYERVPPQGAPKQTLRFSGVRVD